MEQVAAVFHGRSRELDIVLPALYECRNVLIRGPWGIGKTALIKTLLYRLKQEVDELSESMLVLYLGGIPKATTIDFYRGVLLVITQYMSANNPQAKTIAENLTGMAVQSSKTKTEGGVNIGVFSLKITAEPNTTEIRENDIYQQLLFWLGQAEAVYGKVIIAVDDLDKRDTPVVQEIIENSLDLFRQGANRAFVMTGRGFTDLQEATFDNLGIFSENLQLQPMSKEDLRQILINYLNTARREANDSEAPFTSETLHLILDAANGNPRQLNKICEKLLRQGAMQRYQQLDLQAWETLWPMIRMDSTQGLSPHLQRLLYIAYQEKGLSENITNATLDKLDVVTFNALLPDLQELEKQDLMLRVEGDRGFRFVPSNLYQPPESDQKNEPLV
jgi:Cdc6-like AAA superfamily ATPase